MISTRDLTGLPKPEELRRVLQSFALLDAVLEEDVAADAEEIGYPIKK
jgi:hypothetical protein